jgi:hypothetical protein
MPLSYIDPGAGTIILQAVIAAVLGVLIFFRDTVKAMFRFVFPGRNTDEPAEKPAAEPAAEGDKRDD